MIECIFSVSWQLNGPTEFARFTAKSASQLFQELSEKWDEASAEGAQFDGEDEPMLTFRTSHATKPKMIKEITFTISRNSASFFAKTDEIYEFESEWEEFGIQVSNLPQDSDPSKLELIFDAVAAWSGR